MSRFPDLRQFNRFAYDTESDGLRYPVNKAFGFSISTPDGKDYYWDIRHDPAAITWLQDELSKYRGIIIGHNVSFDYKMSRSAGIDLPIDQLDDTVIRACLIDEHLLSYSLDDLGIRYLRMGKDDSLYEKMAEIFGGRATKNVQMKRISEAPIDIVAPYAMRDTRLTLDLWNWQHDEISKQEIFDIIAFERKLIPTMIRAEIRGIRVDLNYAEEAADKLTPVIDKMQSKVNKLSGWEFNINSSPQIKKYFNPVKKGNSFIVGDTIIGKTGTGNASLSAESLRSIDNEMSNLILNIRSVTKTRDTFLRGHVLSYNSGDRIYPTINQNKGEDGGTGTGRLSYRSPAMQQIPSRSKETASIVKPCFLPDEGQVWVDIDEASFEVRVFAALVNNPDIIEAYKQDPMLDFHQFVADLTGLNRNATYAGEPNAKQLSLSLIFNSGNGAIAHKMGMPWSWETFTTRSGEEVTYRKAGKAALDIIDRYHNRIKGVKQLANGCKLTAESRGYIFTRLGRRLRFPNKQGTYKASGLLIQATAADINKENWMAIEETLGDRGNLILNTHDSYSMSMDENWRSSLKDVIGELEKPKLRVPLRVDVSGVGDNWWNSLNNKGGY